VSPDPLVKSKALALVLDTSEELQYRVFKNVVTVAALLLYNWVNSFKDGKNQSV
jgi:hypothetical protein